MEVEVCRVLQGCKGVPTYLAALEVKGKLYLVMQVSTCCSRYQTGCNRLQCPATPRCR